MQSSIWLAPPAAASHFEPERQSFADRQRWERMSEFSRARADWRVSRALLDHVRPADSATSLSHAGGFAALATSPAGTRIGVDVELADAGRDVMRLARFAFAAHESAQLEALPAGARAERFHVQWTLKEACIKAFGLTLLEGLKRYAFWYEEGRWHADCPETAWQACVFRPRPALYLAVLAQGGPQAWRTLEWPGPRPAAWPLIARLSSP